MPLETPPKLLLRLLPRNLRHWIGSRQGRAGRRARTNLDGFRPMQYQTMEEREGVSRCQIHSTELAYRSRTVSICCTASLHRCCGSSLTTIYQVQVERKYAHRLKVADYRSVIFGPQKRASRPITRTRSFPSNAPILRLNLTMPFGVQAHSSCEFAPRNLN